MERRTRLKEALKETSHLRELVRTGMDAFERGDVKLIAADQRSKVGDSLNLDEAARREHPEANRWDYIISIPELISSADRSERYDERNHTQSRIAERM